MSGTNALRADGFVRAESAALTSIGLSDLTAAGGMAARAERPSKRVLNRSTSRETQAEKIFGCLVDLKTSFATFAMHVPREIRERYFARIDAIVDPEDWPDADLPPAVESFQDFVRTLLFFSYGWQPELALNHDGVFVAAWYSRSYRLTVEFVGRRQARWVVSRETSAGIEYASGRCVLQRLRAVLEPYAPERPIFT